MLDPGLFSCLMFKIISQNISYYPFTDPPEGSEKLISLSKVTQLEGGKVRIGTLVRLTPNLALSMSNLPMKRILFLLYLKHMHRKP